MRISDWSSDVCSSDLFGQERGRWRYAIRHISRLWRMAVPRRSGNASGAGRYSGQAIATTPGSAYRCITKGGDQGPAVSGQHRSEEHTSELQALMRISYAVFRLKKKTEEHQSDHRQTARMAQ